MAVLAVEAAANLSDPEQSSNLEYLSSRNETRECQQMQSKNGEQSCRGYSSRRAHGKFTRR